MFENVNRGMYLIGGKEMYFRSGWEARYAKYLEWLKSKGEIKDWKFEPRIFDFAEIRHGTTRYIPDFEVINNNGSIEYHEVKGYMDNKSKTKIKRFRKFFLGKFDFSE